MLKASNASKRSASKSNKTNTRRNAQTATQTRTRLRTQLLRNKGHVYETETQTEPGDSCRAFRIWNELDGARTKWRSGVARGRKHCVEQLETGSRRLGQYPV